MNIITIKPHHFIDIMKLYGAGIEVFVPDEKMKHDFYKIANRLIENPQQSLKLTIDADDICQPCCMCKNQKCIDTLHHIANFDLKHTYNQMLDQRILHYFHLSLDLSYSAYELCEILLKSYHLIDNVWQEENQEITIKRKCFFQQGAKKYLSNHQNLSKKSSCF